MLSIVYQKFYLISIQKKNQSGVVKDILYTHVKQARTKAELVELIDRVAEEDAFILRFWSTRFSNTEKELLTSYDKMSYSMSALSIILAMLALTFEIKSPEFTLPVFLLLVLIAGYYLRIPFNKEKDKYLTVIYLLDEALRKKEQNKDQ